MLLHNHTLAIALGLALVPGVALAQRAQTGPVTPNLVTMTFGLGDHQPATLMIHEGELGRFGDGTSIYGVVARVRPDTDALTVRVFQILTFDGGGEGIILLSKTTLRQGERTTIATPAMSLSVDDVQRIVPYQPVSEGEGIVDNCCVSCSDLWVCGLCVRTDCGCCCDPGYCHPRCTENCPKPPG